MKNDHPGWKALRLILPVVLYMASFMIVRFLIGRLWCDRVDAASLTPILLLLPIAVLCRKSWRDSRIELPILGAVVLLSLLSLGRGGRLPAFLGTVIAGPVNEESIYRGCTYEQGKKFLGAKWSACLSALLFAAGHGSLTQALVAFAAGLVFAFSLEKTRLIEVPMGLHCVFNAVQFLLSSL